MWTMCHVHLRKCSVHYAVLCCVRVVCKFCPSLTGVNTESKTARITKSGGRSNENLRLTLPGSQLDFSVLFKEKFRGRSNKEGALQALRNLDDNGLGKLEEKQTKGSIKVQLDEKRAVFRNWERNIIYLNLCACNAQGIH